SALFGGRSLTFWPGQLRLSLGLVPRPSSAALPVLVLAGPAPPPARLAARSSRAGLRRLRYPADVVAGPAPPSSFWVDSVAPGATESARKRERAQTSRASRSIRSELSKRN